MGRVFPVSGFCNNNVNMYQLYKSNIQHYHTDVLELLKYCKKFSSKVEYISAEWKINLGSQLPLKKMQDDDFAKVFIQR